MEDGKNADSSATISGIFCELCSLEFTTKSELEEHSWSLLHNTNLNRKKGRDCVHQCSLCNQAFVGLLDFTSHIHGENHQENIHKWRKEQLEDQNHNENGQDGSQMEEDWTTDDVSKVIDSKHFCQENTDVPIMADYYGNQEHPWGSGGAPMAKHIRSRDVVRDRQSPVDRDLYTDQGLMNESRERVKQWDRWHHPHQNHHQKFNGEDEREYTSEYGNYGAYYHGREELNHSNEYFDADHQRATSSEGERYDIYYGNRKQCRDASRNRNRGVYAWSRHHKQRHGKPGSGCKVGSSRSSQEDFARNRSVNRSVHSSQQDGKESRRLPKRNKHSSSRDSGSHPDSYQERRHIGDDQSLNRKSPDQVKQRKDDPQKRSSPQSRSLQSPAEKPGRKNKPRKLIRSAEKKEERRGRDDTLVERSNEVKRDQKAETSKTKKVSGVKEMTGKEKGRPYSTAATTVKQSGGSVCALTESNSCIQEKSTEKKDVKSRDRSYGDTKGFGTSSAGGKKTTADNHDRDFERAQKKKEGKEIVVDRRENMSGSQQRAHFMDKKEILPLSKAKGPVSQQWKVPMEEVRSLLGIKKEPLDLESEECPPSSTTAAELNKPPRDCSSNNSGFVSVSRSPSCKAASTRLVPVLSQMSLSRPQCSFVHIDGVQCSAVTWNKYCSYHQRIEEEKNPGNSGLSEGSHRSKEMHLPDPSRKPPCGRPGGTQIFRPQIPLDDLPVNTGLVGGTATGQATEPSHSSFSHRNDFDEKANDPGASTSDAAVPSGDIDLNSTLSTVGQWQDSARDANAQREIYLSDTVPRPGRAGPRPGSLHRSLRSLNSSPTIDLSQTVPGRNEMCYGPTFDSNSGSKTSRNPTVQRYARGKVISGPSTGGARSPEVDIGVKGPSFGKSSTLRKVTVADNDPIIDLNQTVPRHGRIVLLPASSTDDAVGGGTDHGTQNGGRSFALPSSLKGSEGNSKVNAMLDLRSSLSGLAGSQLQSGFSGEDPGETRIGQRSPGSSSCNSQKHNLSSNPNTEMIDLNFSTKLLGIPHSVGGSFNSASNRLPKTAASPLAREVERSSSDFVARSPGYYTASSPQSPLSSRPSTGPGAPSPGFTSPLPNLTLNLSRFNLPPAVRQALAERYNTKSQPSCANAAMSETGSLRGTIADGRRSQPLFAEHAGNGVTEDSRKTMSSLPRRIRCQRSVSLDSVITKSGNLPKERSTRLEPFDKGDVWGPTHLITERKRNLDDEEYQHVRPISPEPSVSPCNNVPRGSSSSLTSIVSSTVNLNRLGSVNGSHGLQPGELIDLSATTYLEGISEASTKIDLQAGSTTSRANQVQSPERCTALPSRGLIDLNSSASFRVLGSAAEKAGTQSIIKRKRLSSQEPEGSVGLSEENLVKRRKHGASGNQEDTAATYQAGLNVQELLTIERDEEEQLQALHDVQSRLKSVRAQIQKLCTELDALHSEENRISVRMGELRNLRLSILENACYEKRRRALTTRLETISREPASSRTEIADRTWKGSRVPETISGASDGAKEVTATSGSFAGNFARPLLPKTLPLKDAYPFSSEDLGVRSDYDEKDMEMGSDLEQVYLPVGLELEDELRASCSTGDHLSSSARASEGCLQSVGASEANQCQNTIKQCEISQPNTNSSNRALVQWRSCGSESEVDQMVTQTSPSGNKPKELGKFVKVVPHNDRGDVRSSVVSDSNGVTGAPVLVNGGSNGQQKEVRNVISQTKNDLGRKIKHLYRPEKSPRKKSFSDVNVSKTIEASRKKIQSVKQNMKRWKKQEEEIASVGINEGRHRNPNDSFGAESNENSVGCLCSDELAPTSSKSPDELKSNPGKTTKELKKSSLFQSKKKISRNVKDESEATHARSKSEETEGVPSKKRKIDEPLMNGGDGLCAGETTISNEEGQVANTFTHTTSADMERSGTENTTGNEEEIPTRDVDTELEEQSSDVIQRVSHLQIPSSTVESLKKSLPKEKVAGQNSRGPTANTFSGHTGAVCGLKVHNGYLFACSADKTTRSFVLQTGECAKVYLGHHQAVNCLEILADKDRLFTGSNDQTVRSYNIKSGVCSHKFTFDGRVMCLHAAFDLLFVGLSTGIVASIDVNNNKCLDRLHCHEPRGVSCLTTATEGQRRLLCTGSFDCTITIRDFKSGLLIRTLSDHAMTVLCLQVVEHVVYSGSADMKVQAHNLNTGELLRSYLGHSMSVSGLQIVGRVLVTSCLDKLVRCYDLMSAELLQVYGGQMDMIFSVHVNSGKIYSGARDGSVTGVKLDLRVYHPCKWTDCQLNFGIVAHLKNHLREYHVMEQGTVEACHWAKCGHQFSAEDDIKVVLRHVLGHVVSRSARKSVS